MANTKSAKKADRRNDRRTAVNKARRTRVRGTWRSVEEAIAAGDAKKAQEALRKAESETMRPFQTASISSSDETTLSRCLTR